MAVKFVYKKYFELIFSNRKVAVQQESEYPSVRPKDSELDRKVEVGPLGQIREAE